MFTSGGRKRVLKDVEKETTTTTTTTTTALRERHEALDAGAETGDGEGPAKKHKASEKVVDLVEEREVSVVHRHEDGMDKTTEIEWVTHKSSVLFGSYAYSRPQLSGRSTVGAGEGEKKKIAIAGFDLDGTIITTQSGFAFARNEKDWKFLFGEKKTVDKFKKFIGDSSASQNRLIVIFSNQNGIALNPKKVKADQTKTRLWQFKTKLAKLSSILARDQVLPFYVVAATNKDDFRKPQTGMWELVKEAHERHLAGADGNQQQTTIELDKEDSYFVGDAAGRKGDHSAVDKEFAQNLGVRFYTPEEYFDDASD
ncbi:polynucleotide kinase 3 phosphatase-domain-containing protein [Myxozyma melibiosi]|uniref:Polynucleotide kinase 3 phosphatase-domain-containing protein n=1 Tax=Myxozyma melibiosi TaxID=54550 RepID=A0ABR1FEG8_9ASCO